MGPPSRFLHATLRRLGQALLPPARFRPAGLERDFRDSYARQNAWRRRVSAGLGLLVWTGFAGFDLWQGSPALGVSLALRFTSSLILAGCIALSFQPRFMRERFAEALVVGGAIAAHIPFLGTLIAVDRAADPLLDGVGLMAYLAFMSNFTFLRARAILFLLAFDLVTGAAALAFDFYATERFPRPVGIGELPSVIGAMGASAYVITVSYMAIAVFVGYASATQREHTARLAFERERGLADANRALERSRRDVEDRTRDLVAAEEALRVLAERRSQEKSRFLAEAAHDLSQPIHAVGLLIEASRQALARGDLAQGRALTDTAARAGQVARAAFSAVLEISQLESGLVRPAYGLVDVAELLADVLAPLRVVAEAGQVALRVRASRVRGLAIRTDRALLGRALTNLVSNAIKYADPAKGPRQAVLVSVVARRHGARIDVVDNGLGVPAARMEDIFKPFVQLHNPLRDRERGLGLGLSIVRATADLLEGHRLDFRSREGRGVRVSFHAPRVARPAAAAASTGAPAALDLAALFIWCVEDDRLAREALVALLESLGVLVQASASFDDLERDLGWTDRRPDLVISDYRLPGGFTADDVARSIAARWDRDVPLLVVTGEAAPARMSETLARTQLARKPLAAEALTRLIAQLCSAGVE